MTRFFALLLALAGMGLVDPAQSQDYPSRPIRLVIGYAAGGGADTIARFFADKLSALAGKQVLVENKPGATGAIAHVYVAKSKPDGYTIYMVGLSSLAATPFFYKSPSMH